MISRRPNMRASNENAPGPTLTMVTSIVMPKMSEGVESNTLFVLGGNSESIAATVPNPAAAPATGVTKPTRIRLPTSSAVNPTTHVARVRPGSPR